MRQHEFVNFDDAQYVSENPHVSGGLTWKGVTWAFRSGHAGNWHPLTWLSHMVDVQLFGVNAGAHHLTNVLLHTANTLLLFWVLCRMTGALGRSGFVAALFAVHPLHVESVAWVAERKDVLSTLFWMLTLWAYVAYTRQPRLGRYVAVVVLFALGLMAKPMLVTLPFVLLLLDFWPLHRLSGGGQRGVPPRVILEKLPLLVLVLASSAITFVVQQRGGAVKGLEALPIGRRAANALLAYVTYVGQMLWPADLAAIYPYPESVPIWWVLAAALGLTAISVAVGLAARRHPYLLVGWMWYLVTLAPVIGLVQVGGQPRADRYTYIPLIGLLIIVAWGVPNLLARWARGRVALATAAALAILACTVAARGQARHRHACVGTRGGARIPRRSVRKNGTMRGPSRRSVFRKRVSPDQPDRRGAAEKRAETHVRRSQSRPRATAESRLAARRVDRRESAAVAGRRSNATPIAQNAP